jgi:hypothetical protein
MLVDLRLAGVEMSHLDTSKRTFDRWPVPLWNPYWVYIDGVRRDLFLGTIIGAIIGIWFATLDDWKEGALAVGVPFACCAVVQISIGISRLHALLERTKKEKHGLLKIRTAMVLIALTLVCSAIFPIFGLIVAGTLLCVRLALLDQREDSGLLIGAACIWVVLLLSATIFREWPAVVIAIGTLSGLVTSAFTLDEGYRLARLPKAMLESTTIVFGIVLAGISVARTAAMLAASTPGTSTLQNAPSGRPTEVLHVPLNHTGVSAHDHLIPVRGYVREVPTTTLGAGQTSIFGPRLEVVQPHVRTPPDGILENNLSYKPQADAIRIKPENFEVRGNLTSDTSASKLAPAESLFPVLEITCGAASWSAERDARIGVDLRNRRTFRWLLG